MSLFACFKAAFSSNFIEGETQTYHLEDAREKDVSYLVQWIYTKDICTTDDVEGFYDLIELCILADRLCMSSLENQTIDRLVMLRPKLNSNEPVIKYLTRIYKASSSESRLREFVVDSYAECSSNSEFLLTPPQLFPKEFLSDLVIYFFDRQL